MTKPVIVQRTVKGEALTYAEHDANFTNLRDATISLTADTGGTQVSSDLNGVITLVAGTNITITGDNTAKTLTIASSASTNSFTSIDPDNNDTVVADSSSDTLRLAGGAGISTSGNATSDTITISVDSQQTTITEITNSASGANINFPNGSVYVLVTKHTPTATAPATPLNGMIYYDSGTHKFRGYANGAWVDLN